MNVEAPDREIIGGLWLGNTTATIYEGQYGAVLTVGHSMRFVNIQDNVKHRHADYPEDINHEARMAHWLQKHWFEGRACLVRADPIINGERIIARMLLSLGSAEHEALNLIHPAPQT